MGGAGQDGSATRQGDGSRLRDYDYPLPQERIALRPASPRDAAKLLVSRPDGRIKDALVRDLPLHLRPGDRLVVNDSRVIPARLVGERVRGEGAARVELTLLAERRPGEWEAFARPAKKLAPGDVLRFAGAAGNVDGTVTGRDGGAVTVRFGDDPLEAGSMPLPPYIAGRRPPDKRDAADYQTVYARAPGSVAAPTAGLHFTERLLEELRDAGIGLSTVTLHVGAGTFLPVKAERIDGHEMHAEMCELTGRPPRRSAPRKSPAGASSPSAPRRCAFWRPRAPMVR